MLLLYLFNYNLNNAYGISASCIYKRSYDSKHRLSLLQDIVSRRSIALRLYFVPFQKQVEVLCFLLYVDSTVIHYYFFTQNIIRFVRTVCTGTN